MYYVKSYIFLTLSAYLKLSQSLTLQLGSYPLHQGEGRDGLTGWAAQEKYPAQFTAYI